MKITIYTLTTDTDHGTSTAVFSTESERDNRAWSFVKSYYPKTERASLRDRFNNPSDAFTALTEQPGFMDHLIMDAHEIEVPASANGAIAASFVEAANDVSAALDSCTFQIDQMRHMFSDSDGTIQQALDDAEVAQNAFRSALAEAPPVPAEKPCVVVIVSGGNVQDTYKDPPNAAVDVVVYDEDNGDSVPEDDSGATDWSAIRRRADEVTV